MFSRGQGRSMLLLMLIWISFVGVSQAQNCDMEMLDIQVSAFQDSPCTGGAAFLNQPTCFAITWQCNACSGGCELVATVTLQDPAGVVILISPALNIFENTFTLANHSYQPTQLGMLTVTCTIRPANSPPDFDPNGANNTRVKTYEVTSGQPVFTCAYDSVVGAIDYSVSGAPTSALFTVSGLAAFSVGIPASLPALVGPSAASSAPVSCLAAGNGDVTLSINDGTSVVKEFFLCFGCAGLGTVPVLSSCAHLGTQQVPLGRRPLLIILMALVLIAASRGLWRSDTSTTQSPEYR